MDIDMLKAGRELDALVAEKVMGCKIERRHDGLLCRCDDPIGKHAVQSNNHNIPYLLCYSTDIAAAWEVVEKMMEKALLEHIQQRDDEVDGKWAVQFCAKSSNEPWWHEHAFADTVPLAICRAALKAIGA